MPGTYREAIKTVMLGLGYPVYQCRYLMQLGRFVDFFRRGRGVRIAVRLGQWVLLTWVVKGLVGG